MRKLLLYMTAAIGFLLLGNKAYAQTGPTITYAPTSYTLTAGAAATITPTVLSGVAGSFGWSAPTVTIAPALSNGTLAINAGTGVISGTPAAAAGVVTYTITATCTKFGNGPRTATATITITVINPVAPAITYPSPDTYTAGTAIATLNPTNTGGGGVTYTTTGLPAGLSLNAGTGAITGTPTTAAGIAATNYSVTATNITGSSTFNINITINPVPAPNITYPSPRTYTAGTAIATLNPTNTGGGFVTYTTTGLPAGLSLNAGTGAITGTPTTVAGIAATNYSVTATNATGSSTFNINITINPQAPAIAYSTPQTYTAGVAITTLNPTNTGGPVTTYTTTGLPAGLTLDAVTGAITGTPTTLAGIGATNYFVTATNSTGTSTATIRITINPAAPAITYVSPQTYTAGTAIATLNPTNTGGGGVTYTTTGLPAGLALNAGTGAITGTPTTAAGIASANYSVTATNVTGSSTFLINITINPVPAPNITYPTPRTYTAGTAIATLNPTNTGGGFVTYTTTGLPAGLSLNAGTGAITGTPTTLAGIVAANYSVTATNASGSNTFNINITINPAAPVIAYASPQTYTAGLAIATLSPTNSGGPPASYAVTGTPLPAGLSLNVVTGDITGTPTTLAGIIATNYRVIATNSTGTSTATIRITINPAAPAITYASPQTYTAGTAIAALNPANTGGPVTTYTTTGLPAGLALNAGSGAITGTPTTAAGIAAANYSVTATNGTGSSTFLINITINPVPAPNITYPTPRTYTAGTAIATLNPTNTGGGFVTYTTTGLPAGLSLNAATGAITGTPTTIAGIAAANYSVTATNVNGVSTFSINITINPEAPVITYPTPQTYVVGTAIATLNLTNTGGPVTTYTTTGLPAGLSLDAVTGAITGTPTTVTAGANYRVTATNVTGSSTATIRITVNPQAPNITYPTPDVYTYATAITTLSPTNTGGTATYTTTGLPAGLTINAGTGAITGTPTTAAGIAAVNYSVTATNVTGSSTFLINITINPAPPALTYSTPDTYAVGASFTLTPANAGSPVASSTISPSLPLGVTMSATGVISGSSSTGIAAVTYVVTATNIAGTTSSNSFTIEFVSPPVISYSPAVNAYTAGVAITPLTPTNTGGAVGAPGYGTGTQLTGATLNTPQGVTFDSSGNVYVADSGNGVIREYNSAGTYLGTFGAAGHLTNPVGIVFDSSGNAYVLDVPAGGGGPGVVVKFTSAGAFVSSLNPRGGTGFRSGFAIAIDASNNLYVTENGNGNVYKFTTAGALTQTIGGFNGPAGIVTDAAGNIYVLDNNNNQVFKYNSAGTYVSTVITGLNNAFGLGIDANGNLFVGDSGTNTVKEYSSGGTLINTITGTNDPEGIVVDATGNVYVSDATNNTLYKYPLTGAYYLTGTLPPGLSFNNSTGTFSGTPTAAFAATTYTITAYNVAGSNSTTVTLSCTVTPPAFHYSPSTNIYNVGTAIPTLSPIVTSGIIGAPGFGAGTVFSGATLNTPQGVALDASGNVYVVDSGNGVIRKYSSAGVYLGNFGSGLTTPMGIVFDSAGNAYVVDQGTGRVYKFNSAGVLQANLNPRGGGGFVSGFNITIDASNNLYVTENGNGNVYKFTTAGVLTQTIGGFNGPAGIVADASGNIYILGNNNNQVFKYNSAGVYVSTVITGLNNAFGLAIDGSGNLYVGDSGTGLMSEYTSSGTLIASVSGLTDPEGLAVDASGNVIVTDATNNSVTIYSKNGGYYLSGSLPGGLNFSSTTGQFTGTPTTVFGPTTYTVTAYSYGLSTTTTVTLSCILIAPSISYTPSVNAYCVGTAITPLSPVNTGGPLSAMTFSATGTQITGATLNAPYGIATDASGNIYVTNSGSGTISKYTSAGVYSGVFSTGYNTPVGIVFDSAGNAYVEDRNNPISQGTIYKITPAGVKTTYIATINSLRGITIDASNNLYITSGGSNAIYKYGTSGATGNLITTFPNTYTAYPTGIALDGSGNVYVLDRTNGNVTEFTSTGAYVSTFLTGFNQAYGLSIDAAGNIYVADSGNNLIKVYNSIGVLQATITNSLSSPQGLITDSFGNIYETNTTNSRVYKYTATGNYSISPALPTGLAFNATTGVISGTPTAVSPSTIYTVTCSNATGPASTTITISTAIAPVISYVTPQTYGIGIPITALAPTNTGGTPDSFAVSPALPAGLSIDPVTGIITGTPTVLSPATNYVITATNACTFSNFTLNITVVLTAPVITYTSPDVYTTGIAITPLAPTNTGGAVASYSISPVLPAGLSIDPVTGIISGTPTVISPATDYLVTATNAAGTGTFTINITCNPPVPSITYPSPDVYNVGTAIASLTPTNTGGPILGFTVSPALPAGLSIDPVTGIITGTPTTITAIYGYVVTATNAGGSSSFTIFITIVSSAPVFTYTTPDNYTVGSAIAPLVPVNTGGTPVSYAISPGLPSGLNFDTTTGIITGTPTAVSAAANYVVTATNAGGTGSFTINIACHLAGPVIAYATPDIFPVGVAIAPLSPTNTGSAPTSYSVSPGLPAGLNFDTTTGIISGTPTIASAATTYTVTATNGTGSGNATLVIACTGYVDWLGGTSTDWNDPANWATNAVPTAVDIAGIGVNGTFTNFPNVLAGTGTINVGAVVIGTNGGQAGGFVVNSGSTLNVTGGITYQSDANSALGYTATISGAGSVTAGGINVNANTLLGASYTETLASSINSMALSSNVALTATDGGGNSFNATFNITGGTVSVAGNIQTNNTAAGTSTLAVTPGTTATLQLANAAPLSGLSATGTNLIAFNNAGAIIEYSGAAQTYYTDAAITGLASGVTYANVKFSGTSVKTPTGTSANNLKISGDLTNAIALNDAGDYIDLSVPTVIFNGITQNIYGGNGTGTKFYNVTFNGTGTTTIQSGSASVASSGLLVMSGAGAVLAANGLLTLTSDINGSATVAPIPAGCSITGNVNVQRFITGGNILYRGYRLVSSPVYAGTVGSNNVYSLNYLMNSVYLKGSNGIAGGFDASGNPNLYLFRENLAPSNSSFTSGNFRGVSDLSAGPSYSIDNDGSGFNIPVGNGYMFFFRGDRNVAPLSSETSTSFVPTNTILTATGVLNQGQITVSDWYTPGSTNLGFTTTPGNGPVQGFNLVGNPYASSIDWDLFNTASPTTGIYGGPGGPGVATNPFVYIIDPVSKNYNSYQSGFGGVGTIASSASNIIPSGQGFFVVAPTATAQLVFNESAKVNTQANAANGNLFLGPPPVANVIQYMHLKLFQDSTNADGMLISFNGSAKPQYNINEDAIYKPGNGTVSLASISADNIALAINTMPLPGPKPMAIPLTVNANTDGNFTIKLEAVKSVPALYDFWLKDAYAKDSLDIRHNPSYAFTLAHSDTNSFGAHRFSLIIRQNPSLMVHLLNFGATKVANGDEVLWTTENEQNYTNFAVERSIDGGSTFNVLGGVPASGIGSYSLLDKAPVLGANAYRLKMTDLNNAVTYSNVVTIMYANTGNQIATNGFILYPNPTSGPMNLKMNQINAGQAYTIQIINNLGAVIKTVTSNQPNWQTDVSSLVPGTYFVEVKNNSTNALVGKSGFVKL